MPIIIAVAALGLLIVGLIVRAEMRGQARCKITEPLSPEIALYKAQQAIVHALARRMIRLQDAEVFEAFRQKVKTMFASGRMNAWNFELALELLEACVEVNDLPSLERYRRQMVVPAHQRLAVGA